MLCKEKVLCADKLFKYRRQQDRSVPQKGGAKDYAPDGSWLQAKRLEAFHQERTAVLAEPRVERLGGLVQGTWDPKRKLVQFKKEMGKFWSHMGFVDESRKWLFPEEALFLMETTVLEVYYGGVPLSIQEAYVRLLGEDVSVEDYQTYAHLRRLGYVVLRHVGGSKITEYERQIKLDQHVKESKRRRHRDRQEEVLAVDTEVKKPRLDPQQGEMDQSPGGRELKCVAMDTGSGKDSEYKESADAVKVKMDSGQMVVGGSDIQQNNQPSFAKLSNPWNLPHKSEGKVPVRHSEWDFETVSFPDIGDKETVVLSIPQAKYLPVNVTLSEEYVDLCLFDVAEYRRQVSQSAQRRRESDNYVFDLNFSYSTWARNRKNIAAANWTEYKLKLSESQSGGAVPSPVDHLWQGEVTPLVKPEDATSTRDVLSRLQVIHSVNLPQPVSKSDRHSLKISFDVHLPNARFKKTRPGLPNHRVCVVRSSDAPPAMADISDAVTRYHDNVPVNWAVVDNGDIAFYNMSSMSLPVDVMMG